MSNAGCRERRAARALAAGVILLAAAALARDLKEAPRRNADALPLLAPSYHGTSHKAVLITRDSLIPRRVELEEGQLVAWISYSAGPSVIVFERDVARSMRCHSLVNFSLVGDELRSAPIDAGEFASFCQLDPGRYRYHVVRPGSPGTKRGASRRLEGELVVQEPRARGEPRRGSALALAFSET